MAVNFRNPYEVAVSSFGEAFLSDNDNDGIQDGYDSYPDQPEDKDGDRDDEDDDPELGLDERGEQHAPGCGLGA